MPIFSSQRRYRGGGGDKGFRHPGGRKCACERRVSSFRKTVRARDGREKTKEKNKRGVNAQVLPRPKAPRGGKKKRWHGGRHLVEERGFLCGERGPVDETERKKRFDRSEMRRWGHQTDCTGRKKRISGRRGTHGGCISQSSEKRSQKPDKLQKQSRGQDQGITHAYGNRKRATPHECRKLRINQGRLGWGGHREPNCA